MRCVKCNRELEEGSRFCEYCGAPQPASPIPDRAFCPNCGKEVPAGSRFCASCGAPMPGMGGGLPMPGPQKPEKDREKTALIVGIAAVSVLIIALIIAIIFLIGSQKKDSREAEERESRYEEEERNWTEEEEEEVSDEAPEEDEAPAEDETLAENETPEEDETLEEQPPEEEDTIVTVTGDESRLTLTTDAGETLVEFTIPSELPIYDEMKFDGRQSMMVHKVVYTGVSGRTIVEPYFADTEETPCEEYIDFYARNTGIDPATAETFTREIDGREVLIYKQQEQTVNDFDQDIYTFNYLFAVPVIENLVLGFRCEGAYGVGNKEVFDDSTVDVLLSHCAF